LAATWLINSVASGVIFISAVRANAGLETEKNQKESC
jgi:hypothetical protein